MCYAISGICVFVLLLYWHVLLIGEFAAVKLLCDLWLVCFCFLVCCGLFVCFFPPFCLFCRLVFIEESLGHQGSESWPPRVLKDWDGGVA